MLAIIARKRGDMMTFGTHIDTMQYLMNDLHNAREQLRNEMGEEYLTSQSWYALQQYKATLEKCEQMFDFCFELALLHNEINDAASQKVIYKSMQNRMIDFIGYVAFQQHLLSVWQESDITATILNLGIHIQHTLDAAASDLKRYLKLPADESDGTIDKNSLN